MAKHTFNVFINTVNVYTRIDIIILSYYFTNNLQRWTSSLRQF